MSIHIIKVVYFVLYKKKCNVNVNVYLFTNNSFFYIYFNYFILFQFIIY